MSPGEIVALVVAAVTVPTLIGGALLRFVLMKHADAMREIEEARKEATKMGEALKRDIDVAYVQSGTTAQALNEFRIEVAKTYMPAASLSSFEDRLLARFDRIEARIDKLATRGEEA